MNNTSMFDTHDPDPLDLLGQGVKTKQNPVSEDNSSDKKSVKPIPPPYRRDDFL